MLLYVFHTSFSKTTLVYVRHVHELQTAKPWAWRGGGGGCIREQKLTLSSNFALKRGGGGGGGGA